MSDHHPVLVPDEVIPPRRSPLADALEVDEVVDPDYDPWDDDGPCCGAATIVQPLLADVRDAAARLEELDPAAREVGRWLRARAQRAALDARYV